VVPVNDNINPGDVLKGSEEMDTFDFFNARKMAFAEDLFSVRTEDRRKKPRRVSPFMATTPRIARLLWRRLWRDNAHQREYPSLSPPVL